MSVEGPGVTGIRCADSVPLLLVARVESFLVGRQGNHIQEQHDAVSLPLLPLGDPSCVHGLHLLLHAETAGKRPSELGHVHLVVVTGR